MTVESVDPTGPAFEEFVDVYRSVFPEDAGGARSFLARYTGYPNWRGLLARIGERPAGMTFGMDAVRGNWWVERVRTQLGAGHPALHDAFCLVELGVLEVHRSQGVGSLLLEALLRAQPRHRALLSTQVANEGAQRFYLRHGWQVLHPGFVFCSGQEPFCVLGVEISRSPRQGGPAPAGRPLRRGAP